MAYCDLKTKKEKRCASVSKNEYFRNLIEQASQNNILFDHVLADNWFAAKENLDYIHYKLEKKFIIGIKSNRTVALSEKEALLHECLNYSYLSSIY